MPQIKIVIPTNLICPITRKLITRPVRAADGIVYEKEAIELWLRNNEISPITQLKLKDKKLVEDVKTELELQTFLAALQLCTQAEFNSAIYRAIEYKSLFFLQKLNYLAEYLDEALCIALIGRYFDLVAWLLAEGASVNAVDKRGSTVLHLVSTKEIADLLLDKGAKTKINTKNDDGMTPLHFAAAVYTKADLVELLLKNGADTQAKDKNGFTPYLLQDYMDTGRFDGLSRFGTSDYQRIVYLLSSHEPNFKEETTADLMLAIRYSQVRQVEYLLASREEDSEANHNIDLEGKDETGETPLCLAVLAGNIDMVKVLLKYKVDVNAKAVLNSYIRGVYSPLHLAAYRNNGEMTQLLLDKGADPYIKNDKGLTPLQLAQQLGKANVVKLLQVYEAPQKIIALENLVKTQAVMIQQLQQQMQQLMQQQDKEGQLNNNRQKTFSPKFQFK